VTGRRREPEPAPPVRLLPGGCPAWIVADSCADGPDAGPPVMSCTAEGFSCPADCSAGGGLLPRLFTLARGFSCEKSRAVCFLWHCLSPRVFTRCARGFSTACCLVVSGLSSRGRTAGDRLPARAIYRPGIRAQEGMSIW